MTDEHLFDGILGLKQSDSYVHHIFHQYIQTLFMKKWQIVDAINDWSKTVMNQVQDHVTQQKKLVEEEYMKKVNNLNVIRDRVLEQISNYEQEKNIEQINQLISKCDTLKMELVTLVYMERPIMSIQIVTEEQLTQQITNESSVNKTIDDDQTPKNNTITNEISPSSQVPTKNIDLSDSSPTLTSPTNEDDQTITSDDRLETHNYSCNNSIEKCPICFMIFPLNMTVHYRNLHVNEHYRDE